MRTKSEPRIQSALYIQNYTVSKHLKEKRNYEMNGLRNA